MTERLAYTPAEIAALAGVPQSEVMRAIHAGELRAKRRTRKYLILLPDAREWLESLPDA